MKYIKLSLIIFMLCASGYGYAFEKVATTSFQFLKVAPGARLCAMGEAFTAVKSGSDAVFYNPAALTNVEKLDVGADYLDWFLDIKHYAFSAAYTMPGLGTLGFQTIFTDVGEIKVTTVDALDFVDGVYLGYNGETINPGATVFGISFARDLTDRFSFGVTAKYAREDLGVKSTGVTMYDAGLIYDTGFKSLNIGAAVRHFGPEVKFYDEVDLPRYDAVLDSTFYMPYTGKSYPLPQTFNIGVSAYLISGGDAFMHSDNHSLLFAADMVQPRDYDQQYNVGLEYGFNDIFFLRGGYKMEYDEESYSFGFGLAYDSYRIDYAFNDFGEYLDSVHRFSIGLSID